RGPAGAGPALEPRSGARGAGRALLRTGGEGDRHTLGPGRGRRPALPRGGRAPHTARPGRRLVSGPTARGRPARRRRGRCVLSGGQPARRTGQPAEAVYRLARGQGEPVLVRSAGRQRHTCEGASPGGGSSRRARILSPDNDHLKRRSASFTKVVN